MVSRHHEHNHGQGYPHVDPFSSDSADIMETRLPDDLWRAVQALFRLPNLWEKSLREVKEKLANLGLTLA